MHSSRDYTANLIYLCLAEHAASAGQWAAAVCYLLLALLHR